MTPDTRRVLHIVPRELEPLMPPPRKSRQKSPPPVPTRVCTTISGFVCAAPETKRSCQFCHGTIQGAVFCRLRDELAGEPELQIMRGGTFVDAFGRVQNTFWWADATLAPTVELWRKEALEYRLARPGKYAAYVEYCYVKYATEPRFGPRVRRVVRNRATEEELSVREFDRGVEVPAQRFSDLVVRTRKAA